MPPAQWKSAIPRSRGSFHGPMNRRPNFLAVVAILLFSGACKAEATFATSSTPYRDAAAAIAHPIRHDLRMIERWARRTDSHVYAGSYFSPRRAGILRVGFVRDQQSNVEAVRHLPGVVEASRLLPFPNRPTYSLHYLTRLADRIVTRIVEDPRTFQLINGWSIDVRRNRVAVGTEHPRKVRTIIHRVFGPDAPVRVERREGASPSRVSPNHAHASRARSGLG